MKNPLTPKFLRMSLCLMCLMLSSLSLFAATKFTIGDLTYTVADDGAATCCVSDCKETATQVTIPSEVEYDGKSYSVSYIDNNAFRYYTNLRSVTIPNSVTSIGDYAFGECSRLLSVTIPNSVTSIGDNAFYGCVSLTSVAIPNSVTSIGGGAFSECSSLTSVVIPNSVTSIGYGMFYRCISLTSVTIPNSVTSIGDLAFLWCESLTSATIPNSVTSIGEKAFYMCRSLTLPTIPSSVTEFGEESFYGCTIMTLTIPDSITSFEKDAFSHANIVKAIWLPKTPPSGYGKMEAMINYVPNDSYAFSSGTERIYQSLSSLFEVDGVKYVPVSTLERTCVAIDCACDETAENINIGKTVNFSGIEMKVLDINSYCCYGNPSVKTIKIDNDACGLGDYVFYGCSAMTSADITANSIGDYAFSGCSALENFSFGTSLKSIGDEAFSGCTAMTKLTANAQVPPTCGERALDDISKRFCTLYVPEAQIDAYKAADQWKEFFIVETTVDGVTVNGSATEVARYNLYGARLSVPQRGINVVRMSDGTTKKVLVR